MSSTLVKTPALLINMGALTVRARLVLLLLWAAAVAAAGASKDGKTYAPSAAVTALQRWYVDGGGFMHGDVAIRALGEQGNGLIAEEDLPQDATVLEIPLQMVINIEHALMSPLAPLIEKAEFLPDTEAMAIFLLWEAKREQRSPLAKFLAALPRVSYGTLLQIEEDVLQQLQISGLAKHTIAIDKELEKLWNQVQKTAEEDDKLSKRFATFFSTTTFNDFVLALYWVQSRQFRVSVKDQKGEWIDTKCLVPMADMINMATRPSQVNVLCGTNAASTHFVCSTTKPVPGGTELLTGYGALPDNKSDDPPLKNWRLLLDYGFTVDDVAYDGAVLHFTSSPFATSSSAKADTEGATQRGKLFKQWVSMIQNNPMAEITHDQVPRELLAWARIEALESSIETISPELRSFIFTEPLVSLDDLASHPFADLETLAQSNIRQFFTAWLNGYNSSLQQDTQLLEYQNPKGFDHQIEAIKRMIRVRMGEKRVLLDWLQKLPAPRRARTEL